MRDGLALRSPWAAIARALRNRMKLGAGKHGGEGGILFRTNPDLIEMTSDIK